MKQILLDTNAYSSLHKGDSVVRQAIFGSDLVLISVITLGELFRGFKEGSKESTNTILLERFLDDSKIRIIEIKKNTAKVYGDLSSIIRKKGTPLPSNDVWIASQVIATNSLLITYDKHFLKIPGLKIWPALK